MEFAKHQYRQKYFKISRVGIYKPSVQAEILQNSQEVEFINHQYSQKYCKILKRWNLKKKVQAEILQKYQVVMLVFSYKNTL